ncbi:tyrosine-type recombinase/integrase [Lachnospiraceae bacterium LCP25S3_G4]
MGKYKKRSDGRYASNIIIGTDEETGKRIYAPTIYASSIDELDRKKALIKADLDRGTYANDKGLTVGIWADKWVTTFKEGVVASSTLGNYKNIIKNHIEELKDIRLKDLKKSDVQLQINRKSSMPEIQRMLKITINQMLEDAIDDGLIYKNVCRGIKTTTLQNQSKRALTDSEKKAIKNCDFTDMEKAFVYILLFSGLRRSEALALTKSDIDFNRNVINVNKSLTWSNGTHLKAPKSVKSNRCVNMPTDLKNCLKSYLNGLQSIYLFHSSSGQLISQSTYKRFWNEIYNKVNCELGGTKKEMKGNKVVKQGIKATDITPHTFRHNYATMLYYGGIDVKEAQRLLGHSSIKVTLEIYTHLIEDNDDLNDKLNNAISF